MNHGSACCAHSPIERFLISSCFGLPPRDEPGRSDEQGTIVRRIEQHRDRWSLYGAETGIRELSSYLTPGDLKQYDVFQGFNEQLLATISPDVSVAVWNEGAVLFEAGSYVDVAFFLVEGAVAVSLEADAGPGADDGRTAVSGPREARDETVFLSTMDFDLATRSEVLELGPGECFGEIGALNGWPQSVTAKALREAASPDPRARPAPDEAAVGRLQAAGRRRLPPPRPAAAASGLRAVSGCPQPVLSTLAERVEPACQCKPGSER